jgi:peroxiredoxin
MDREKVMDNVNVLRVGFMAPDFSLTDTQGRLFSLREGLKDGFLAICFFPGGPGARIKGYLKDLSSGLPASAAGIPVQVVGICPDRVNSLEKLGEELKIGFPVLSDSRLSVASRYYVVDSGSFRPSVYFSVFVVDDGGIIRLRASEVPGLSVFSVEELRSEISGLI